MTTYTLPPGKMLSRYPMFADDAMGADVDDFDLQSFRMSGWATKGGRPTPPTGSGGRVAPSSAPSGPSPLLLGAAALGQLSQAYAAFHAVQMAQIETGMQSDFMSHRARMLALDYSSAVRRAEGILEQGQEEAGRVSLEGEHRRASIEADTGARGVVAGVGNAAEVLASEKLLERADVYNINLDSVRQANAARADAVSIANEARFSQTSARNLRRTARYAMPEMQLFGGLASSASSVALLRSR